MAVSAHCIADLGIAAAAAAAAIITNATASVAKAGGRGG
jgi:hypothetical protein